MEVHSADHTLCEDSKRLCGRKRGGVPVDMAISPVEICFWNLDADCQLRSAPAPFCVRGKVQSIFTENTDVGQVCVAVLLAKDEHPVCEHVTIPNE